MTAATAQGQPAPYVDLTAGYPDLSRSIRRNLHRAASLLGQDGVREVIRFYRREADLAALRLPLAVRHLARCAAAGRLPDLGGWYRMWPRAGEAGILTLDGRLAAWTLAELDPPVYRVLAGQMVPGLEAYRPGRVLEEALLRRVLEDGQYRLVDWGSSEHADALIAVSPALTLGLNRQAGGTYVQCRVHVPIVEHAARGARPLPDVQRHLRGDHTARRARLAPPVKQLKIMQQPQAAVRLGYYMIPVGKIR